MSRLVLYIVALAQLQMRAATLTASPIVVVSMRSRVPIVPTHTSPVLRPMVKRMGSRPVTRHLALRCSVHWNIWMAALRDLSALEKKTMNLSPISLSTIPLFAWIMGIAPDKISLRNLNDSSGLTREAYFSNPVTETNITVRRFREFCPALRLVISSTPRSCSDSYGTNRLTASACCISSIFPHCSSVFRTRSWLNGVAMDPAMTMPTSSPKTGQATATAVRAMNRT
mmetsp:Transcript_90505/g.156815  ORF Transcript_90505/g.156815 Transcript_90505/m.156815 type:complete len:227 (+) Transcript_90505:737-1417(+)